MKRLVGLILGVAFALSAVFIWGLVTAKYEVFPWALIQPAGSTVSVFFRSLVEKPPQNRVETTVSTALQNFDLTILNDVDRIKGSAGGLAVTDRGILIGRRPDGIIMLFDAEQDALVELPYQLPPLFGADLPERFDTGRTVSSNTQRYHDIEVVERFGASHLFVTDNYYDLKNGCFGIALHEAILPAGWDRAPSSDQPLVWRTMLRSAPCLPPGSDRNTFAGFQAGGRIVAAPDGGILVTTGDLEFDGIGRKELKVSQLEDAASDLGRVLRFDPSGEMTVVSRGHRNPQGLTFDNEGRLWLVEHGPQGGDELNLVEPGKNYGWPVVTFGTMYSHPEDDAKTWPGNPLQGHHDGYESPRHSWLPAVAPSAIAVARDLGPRWEGDLIVSTLVGEGLRRLRHANGHIVYDEPIPFGTRIRDILIANGRIYLLSDDGRFGYLTPREMHDENPELTDNSNELRNVGCLDCHGNPTRPRLAEIVDHDVASQGEIAYSDALRRVGGKWTPERLERFLMSPSDFAPGTTMPDPELDASQLEAIINELQALADEGE